MDFDVSKIGIDPNALENAALGDFDDYVEKPTAQAPVNTPTPTMDYTSNANTQNYNTPANEPTGYGSYTGAPIYGNNAGTQGYDTNMGAQMGEPTGYDPYTGAPIYGNNAGTQGYDPNMAAPANEPTGYDPYTGAPIYGNNAGTQGYDSNMGAQMSEPTGYDPYTGAPIYGNNAGIQGYDPNMGAQMGEPTGYGSNLDSCPADVYPGSYPGGYVPAIQLKTDRSILKTILLSIVTFGIYGLVCYANCADDVNTVCSRHDGKKTMNYYLLMFIISPITLGIASLVWCHNISDRVGNELKRRGIDYSFSSSDFWLWYVLGALILVGPLVYSCKLLKAVNYMNADYNIKG